LQCNPATEAELKLIIALFSSEEFLRPEKLNRRACHTADLPGARMPTRSKTATGGAGIFVELLLIGVSFAQGDVESEHGAVDVDAVVGILGCG
jgi:hypothetical protein